MVTVGEIVDQLRNYGQDETLEDLLQRADFVSKAQEALSSLPEESQSILRKIFPRNPNKSDKALAAVRKVKNVVLPKEVRAKYNKCTAANFWIPEESQQSLELNSNQPMGTLLSQIYLKSSSLSTKRTWDTISWRFLLQFFADLTALLGNTYIARRAEDILTSTVISSGIVSDSEQEVRKNVGSWRSKGLRYAKLSDSLGNGVPFLLPGSVTDTTWEELPVTTSLFDDAVSHLREVGFCEESTRVGADTLGTEIRKGLVAPFQWHLSSLPCVQGHVTYAQPKTPPYNTTEASRTRIMDNPTSMEILTRAANMISSGAIEEGPNSSYLVSDVPNNLDTREVSAYHPSSVGQLPSTSAYAPPINDLRTDNNSLWQSSAPVPGANHPTHKFGNMWDSAAALPDGFAYIWNMAESVPSLNSNDISGDYAPSVLDSMTDEAVEY